MELEWDEEKRRLRLQHRGLDFADVDRFDPDSIIRFQISEATMAKAASIPTDISMVSRVASAGRRDMNESGLSR